MACFTLSHTSSAMTAFSASTMEYAPEQSALLTLANSIAALCLSLATSYLFDNEIRRV